MDRLVQHRAAASIAELSKSARFSRAKKVVDGLKNGGHYTFLDSLEIAKDKMIGYHPTDSAA